MDGDCLYGSFIVRTSEKRLNVRACHALAWIASALMTVACFATPSFGQDEGTLHQYITLNANAADSTNADQLKSGGGLGLSLTGSGVVAGVWDAGLVLSTHQEFQTGSGSRVIQVDGGSTHSHATHVAGTIGAKGAYAPAEGMATEVTIRSRNWTNDVNELNADANLIDVSNHSYSFGRGWSGPASTSVGNRDRWRGDRSLSGVEDIYFGAYTSTSRNLDTVLHDHSHVLSVWAAGNDRNDSFNNTGGVNQYLAYFSTAPTTFVSNEGGGWYVVSTADYAAPPSDGDGGTGYDSLSNGGQTAKNTLVVGAMNDHTVDPHNGAAMSITSFSSYGGTDDGRLGVNVVGNGAGLISTHDNGDNFYATSSGTSMASPNVAGTAALLIEHFRNEKNDANLKVLSATQKGYLMHTATDVTAGAGTVGPDYATGYGMVNAAASAEFITEAITEPTATREDHLFELTKTDNLDIDMTFKAIGGEVKATLVWTDPQGTAQSGLDNRTGVLVNDLDLSITVGGTTYHPWTLDILNPTNAAVRTTANHVDNVEQVLIDALAIDTLFTLHIGDTGSLLGGSQDFSLLVSGAVVPEPTTILLIGGAVMCVLSRRRRAA